ncbi:MAG: 3-hydroxylacyl-ACP dehydratase [Candidatus Acidiferrales bacterium]
MSMPDIRLLVPHAGPMVLLDRVVSAEEESLCAEVRIRKDSLFCTVDGVGAWVGLEYMAQAISAYAGYTARLRGQPVKVGFLLGTRRYECNCPVFTAGALLRVHVRRVFHSETGLASFECRIDDMQGQVATASLTVFQPANANDFLAGGRNE